MLLRLCSSARRRWKALLAALLLMVVALNAVVFVSVPGVSRYRAEGRGHRSQVKDTEQVRGIRGASHLQIMRKGLDKSTADNSSGLHYVEGIPFLDPKHSDRKAWKDFLHGSSFQDRKKVAGFVYNDNTDNKDDIDDTRRYRDKEEIEPESQERDAKGEIHLRDFPETRERAPKVVSGSAQDPGRKIKVGRNYSLAEVDQLVKMFESRYQGSPLVADRSTSYTKFVSRLQEGTQWGPRLEEFANQKGRRAWEQFHHGIRQHALYLPTETYVNKLMADLQDTEIVDVEQKEGGTQIKLMITCKDEGQALFKPMRFPREQETLPDHFYFADYERHNAEIASFHLDRLLGFYRVPPTVGRWMNISHDIHRVANSKLAKTFFVSPVGNWCFHGSCSYYCDSSHPICGHPIMLEGSMAAFLPPLQMAKRKTWRNPWKRSYSKHRKAYWEVYDDLCHKVKRKHPYNEGRRMMDVLDMSVFDFLIGEAVQPLLIPYIYYFTRPFPYHRFGKSSYDCLSCLAPVRQCCMIRLSTLAKLLRLYAGPHSLSHVMRESLTHDTLRPILLESHLDALDRRLSKILHVIHGCLTGGPEGGPPRPWDEVVVDDGVT
ncbi:hypothetical protein EGW08_020602 [Elysia chlorotica]|uniref:FAM20 C-terminal domain-containing protein n=1 Tax=Elysia chlorotica TaxID=188477 RepID=A0A433SQW8_ELYCH|nr:hypothetical protein EGW08_020602 [Elysia chlorotica]